MKIIKLSDENEMIYEFLKMEMASERYTEKINSALKQFNLSESILQNGNISSEEENNHRKNVLGIFRGYNKNSGLFENFPSEIKWIWSKFSRQDLPKIKYINYSYWNELSCYTGSPLTAVKTILSGKTIYDVPNDGFHNAAEGLKNGKTFPPLIILTDSNENDFIILEGHVRITAYAMAPDFFEDISVILGYCNAEELNTWYGVMPKP